MPLHRRLPKRGFFNVFQVAVETMNLSALQRAADAGRFSKVGRVTEADLAQAGLVKHGKAVKILGRGTVREVLNLRVSYASESAVEKIEAAGGSIELRNDHRDLCQVVGSLIPKTGLVFEGVKGAMKLISKLHGLPRSKTINDGDRMTLMLGVVGERSDCQDLRAKDVLKDCYVHLAGDGFVTEKRSVPIDEIVSANPNELYKLNVTAEGAGKKTMTLTLYYLTNYLGELAHHFVVRPIQKT